MNEPEKQADREATASNIRTISSEELLRGDRQVVILHHGEPYRLLVTRNDKLLLQK